MRKGILGSLAALAAGAGMAWGQSGSLPTAPAGKSFVGGPEIVPVMGNTPAPIIPPSIPVGGGPGGFIPQAGPMYPPPANFSGIDPSSLPQVPSSAFLSPEAPHFWWGAEYLLYFVKSQPTRYPYVTTSSFQSAGRLNNPTTSILFTDSDVPYNISNGFRVNAGYFYDADRRTGFQLEGFVLQEKTKSFATASDAAGSPVLARPFINANTGLQSSIVIATPNGPGTGPIGQVGSISVDTSNQTYSPEGNFVLNLYRSCPEAGWGATVNMLLGLRYIQLEETLTIQSNSTFMNGTTLPPAFGTFPGVVGPFPSLVIIDNFRTLNQFYGGQIGFQSEFRNRRWSLLGNFKLGLGNMHSRVDIDGTTTAIRGLPNPSVMGSVRGGILANGQNIGREHNDRFAVVPEFGLTAGYSLTSRLTFTVGYNFLYLTNVIRPGEIVDPRVFPGLIPASNSFGQVAGVVPRNDNNRESDYFVQGASVGFLFRY